MADRFVKIGGSNLLDGLTLLNAWETPAYGAANVGSTNTLKFDDGTYDSRDSYWTSLPSGTASTDTTVTAINNGAVTFKLLTGLSSPSRVMQLASESHYITINGIVMDGDNRSGDGIHYGASNVSSHITLTNCTIKQVTGVGMDVSRSEFNLVEGCLFQDVTHYGVYNNGGNNTYRGNTFDTCLRLGITAHSNGNSYSGVVVERNLFKNCGYHPTLPQGSIIFYNSQHMGSVIRNNIIWACRRGPQVDGGTANHTIVHNISYACTNEGLLVIANGCTIRNNILLENGTNYSLSGTGNTSDHNQVTGVGTDYWLSPSTGDFTLLDNATTQANVIDQGINVGVTDDYLGNIRPVNNIVDIGHIEFGTAAPPEPPILGHLGNYVVVAGVESLIAVTLSDGDSNTKNLTVTATGNTAVRLGTSTNITVTSP